MTTLDIIIARLESLRHVANLGGKSVCYFSEEEKDYTPVDDVIVENDDSGGSVILFKICRRSRKYPRTCPICKIKTVNKAVHSRDISVNYKGIIHKFFVKDIPCEMCSACEFTTYGNDSEPVINAEAIRLGIVTMTDFPNGI